VSADLYTHGCMQSSSELFVFSVRVFSKKGLEVLYPNSRYQALPPAQSQLCGKHPWASGSGVRTPCRPLSCGDLRPGSSNAAVRAQSRGPANGITARLKEVRVVGAH